MNIKQSPLQSLNKGNWFKLICGASYQHLPSVRNLALAYTLAGADCIDVSADIAVILAAKEGITAANKLKENFTSCNNPWLMVSLNDGEDPHFRKAEIFSDRCPTECNRPCETVCPANAIDFKSSKQNLNGVIEELCYGCGRCVPVCPSKIITTRSHIAKPSSIVPLIIAKKIDAIEIHTQVGHLEEFQKLWNQIYPVINNLKLLAISCPISPDVINYLKSVYKIISPLPCPLIWQTDGRPMSGDLGKGTTHTAIKFAQLALQSNLTGYIQLAGGTNGYTVTKLRQANMLKEKNNSGKYISGVAYGSYARSLLSPILEELESNRDNQLKLERDSSLTHRAFLKAYSLTSQIKQYSKVVETIVK